MELQHEANRIYAADEAGRVVAEIDFPAAGDGMVDICHTVVDDSLRGQGVAGKLVATAAEQIRQSGLKARTTCVYARGWFQQHPEQQDLLAE